MVDMKQPLRFSDNKLHHAIHAVVSVLEPIKTKAENLDRELKISSTKYSNVSLAENEGRKRECRKKKKKPTATKK